MKLYIFSSESPSGETQFFRAVIARDQLEAESIVLNPKYSLRAHLKSQLLKDGVYSHCSNIKEALHEYFPFIVERRLSKGLVLEASNGQTLIY